MSPERLSAAVRGLVANHVRSSEQLETLLLMYRNADLWWSAASVAEELGTSAAATASRLEDMASRNLLDARTAESVLFRFNPVSEALVDAVGELARAHAEHPEVVMKLIYSTPMDDVRGFAAAFRLRGGGEGG